jgi:hypothetical protein
MTHGDANENDDVLACASTAAFGASGRAGRVIAAELADADGTAGAQYT